LTSLLPSIQTPFTRKSKNNAGRRQKRKQKSIGETSCNYCKKKMTGEKADNTDAPQLHLFCCGAAKKMQFNQV